ncbi:hypothetical protein [Sphingomonas sp.]|uniref:hypothetical protein n=1 Tax=Sphingomonas sp. TaxID=28214 RepID=UPI003CC5CF25
MNSAQSLGEQCRGFVANQPDFKVTYNPSDSSSLPFIISVQADSDTMLAVNGPNGTWYCDDDSGGGTNPAIRFNNPASGRYDIFVGTYNSGASAPARLRISELSSSVPSARNFDGGRRTSSNSGGGGGDRPNVGLNATYGARTLNGGFTPDPFRAAVTAGGELDASTLGGACRGWIARAPDYKITYNPSSGSSLPLVVSVASGSDTMLAINDPNGNWYCDDDSGEGVNPALRFTHPVSGRYDIYVGTYERGVSPSAQLRVSELSSSSPSFRDINQNGNSASSDDDRPDPSAASYNGEVTLTTGFTPDPHTRRVTAGGTINAHVVGSQCTGFVGHQPDYKVTYRGSGATNNSGKVGGGGQLPLLIGVTSNADTTLAINGPDGRWYCDDDSGEGTNPLVTFSAPQSGRYDIFVGTYASGSTAPATLTVSERPRR